MELTESLKTLFKITATTLKGASRRVFMARTVQELGRGGQAAAMRELGWSEWSIRKGLRELASGIVCVDAFHLRGRRPVEAHLPRLLDDIRAIVDGQSQTDPQFRNHRLYTRLSVEEVRRQLIAQKGYSSANCPQAGDVAPAAERVGVLPPERSQDAAQKKIAQTDAIFERLTVINAEADKGESMLRLSMDAKASVKVGEFSRHGVSRVATQALDHDFEPEAQVTPVGIFLPQHDALHLFAVTSKVTSDCLADCLEDFWAGQRQHFPRVDTLVLNLDNGPECHSRRTQFMARMVRFVEHTGLAVRLAYYPPYHSKYNPIERCWGVLEHHWNGSLLDSIEVVERFAGSMTWKGVHPVVKRVAAVYETGIALSKDAMRMLETQLQRLPELGKWFVDILPVSAKPSTG